MAKVKKITANQLKKFILTKMKFHPDLKDVKINSISVQKLKGFYFDSYKREALTDYKIQVKTEQTAKNTLNRIDREFKDKPNYKNREWETLRLKVFKRDNNKCIDCGGNKILQCHHTYYIKDRILWDYPTSCFKTLCKSCHEKYHKEVKGKEIAYKSVDLLPNQYDIDDVKYYDATKRNMDKVYDFKEKKIKEDAYIKSLPILSSKDKALQFRYDALRNKK